MIVQIDVSTLAVRDTRSGASGLAAVLLTTALVVNLVLLALRIAYTSQATFNSDSATTSLYAGEVLRSGAVFPPGWHYNNGDAWLYNHTLLLVPLLTVLPNGYAAYAISTALASLLVIGGVAWGLRSLGVRRLTLLAATAILASGISSPFIADLLYDWATYGAQFLMACLELALLAGIVARAREADGRVPLVRLVLLCALVFVSAASNPARAGMYHFAPYLLALVAAWMLVRRAAAAGTAPAATPPGERQAYVVTAACFCLAFALGAMLHRAMVGAGSQRAVTTARIRRRDAAVARRDDRDQRARARRLSGERPRHVSLSPVGLYYSARMVVAVALLAFPGLFLRRAIADLKSGPVSIVALVPAIGFVLALAFHLIWFRYPLPDDFTSIRYLCVPLLMMGVAWVVLARDALDRHLRHVGVAAAVAVAAVLVGYMDNVYPAVRGGGKVTEALGRNPSRRSSIA